MESSRPAYADTADLTLSDPVGIDGASSQWSPVAAALSSSIVAGRTAGSFAVTNSGAATYSIPIWTPPGVGEVGLNLTLTYNSRGPNGVIGQGWSLGGLSSISRCNKTWSQDGAPAPVTNTVADRFCLDGQQLKLVSGTYGAAGSTYATEIESFSVIVANSTIGAGPASFTVTTKNGLVREYGESADSRIFAGSTGSVRTWALSSVHDRLPTPNMIQISYTNEAQNGAYTNGTYRVSSITYPYTATGQGPFYKVEFSYSSRPSSDNEVGYLAGNVVREVNKLDAINIRTYASNALFKSYNLSYDQNPTTNRLRLTAVQECSVVTCFAPSTFGYQNGQAGWSATLVSTDEQMTSQLATGPTTVDLNGDGLNDILYPRVASGSTSSWWVMFATPSGFSAAVNTGVTTPNGTSQRLAADFRGAGKHQVLFQQSGTWYLLQHTGSGFSFTSTTVPVNGEFAVVDYNGDGLPDLASAVGNAIMVRRNTTSPAGALSFSTTADTIWSNTSAFNITTGSATLTTHNDFDGDGRGDLLVTTYLNTGFGNIITWNILRSNGFGAPASVKSLLGVTAEPMPGDWNADGCTDVVSWRDIYVSNCAGDFTTIPVNLSNVGTPMAVDWDGDRRVDLIYVNLSNNTWEVMRSTGEGIAPAVPAGTPAPVNTAWFVFDGDGDGLPDLGYRDGDAGNRIKYRNHAGAGLRADLATSFTDGYGMNQSPSYVSIARSNYTKYTGAIYPEVDWAGALYVVSQFLASDGTGGTYQNSFWYYGAKLNHQGRGFEGFFAQRTLDSRNNQVTFDYVRQLFPYTGIFYQRLVQRSDGSNFLATWSGQLANQSFGASGIQQRFFPYIEASTQLDYDVRIPTQINRQTDFNFVYGDGHGNLTSVSQILTDRDPAPPFTNQAWSSTVNTAFSNTGTCSLPTSRTVTNAAPGQAAQTRTTTYVPNMGACRIEQEVIEPSTQDLRVSIDYGFDSCGNVNSISVVGNKPGQALPARVTTLDYGRRCQVPESITNALNQTTLINYRYTFVVPTQLTDPNIVTTSWGYDNFGRRTSENRPDGTSTTWTYESCSAGCWGAADLRLAVTEVNRGSDSSLYGNNKKYFDGFERLRASQSTHVLGATVYDELYLYDPLGRIVQASVPYSSGSNGYRQWTYDVLDRPLVERLYQGGGGLDRTSTWAYSGRTVAFTDPLNHTRSSVMDVTGRLRSISDPLPVGGTTTYGYDSFGNLNYVRDAIGAESSGAYNLRGFRTQWNDADHGSWTFTPNSLNEPIAWRNARNQTFVADYDALGRLTYRLDAEGPSYFNFGTSAANHNIGRLESMTGLGYAEYLTYDNIAGRLKTRRVVTDQNYDFDYTYNSIGAVDTLSYPVSPVPAGKTANRFTVKFSYSWGVMQKIDDITEPTSVELWHLDAVNDSSFPTLESIGTTPLIKIASVYKPWTNELETRQSGTTSNPTGRQNMNFVWDSAGRLQSRSDVLQSVSETFTYDELDRVSTSQVTGGPIITTNYDAAGNITSKTDVGAYAYGDASHPHAVTGISGATSRSFSYDANGSQIARDGLAQTWASFDLPLTLQSTTAGSTYQSQFNYGPNHQRWKQVATYSNGTETLYYAGDGLIEKQVTTQTFWRHYVHTPTGQFVISRNSDGTETRYFLATDHLGSTNVILKQDGTVLARESFTAFGARRGGNWTGAAPNWNAIAITSRRGFTGHEHQDSTGLIHMNGRVYDPVLGRFLSVDPIANLLDSQSINAYAYVGNRPLRLVDPSGLSAADGCCDGGGGGGGGGFQDNDGSPGSWDWWGNLFESIGDPFQRFFGSEPPPPPPATALLGASAQNGVDMCGAGSSSAMCKSPTISPNVRTSAVADGTNRSDSMPNAYVFAATNNNAQQEPPIEEPLRGGISDLIRQLLQWSNGGCGRDVNCLTFPMWGTPRGGWAMAAESMSARAAAYQAQITGRAGQAYFVKGVRFDGFSEGVLLEAKGPGYANFLRGGSFEPWWRGADEFVKQAQRQLAAAGGTPIRWHFAEAEVANAVRALFQRSGIKGIEIVVTP